MHTNTNKMTLKKGPSVQTCDCSTCTTDDEKHTLPKQVHGIDCNTHCTTAEKHAQPKTNRRVHVRREGVRPICSACVYALLLFLLSSHLLPSLVHAVHKIIQHKLWVHTGCVMHCVSGLVHTRGIVSRVESVTLVYTCCTLHCISLPLHTGYVTDCLLIAHGFA